MKIDICSRIARLKVGEAYTKEQIHSLIGFSERTFEKIFKQMLDTGVIIEEDDKYIFMRKEGLSYTINSEVKHILKSNILKIFLNTMQQLHTGDTILQLMALLSAMTPWINTDNLNIYVTGSSSGGKTHALSTVLKTLPKTYYFAVTSKSEKAIYYAVKNGYINNNAVLLFDDIESYSNFIAKLKTLSWTSSVKPTHWSVQAQKFFHINIENEFVFWLTSIYPINNVEIQNRFVFVNITENEKHKKKVKQFVIEKYRSGEEKDINFKEIYILQDVFTVLSYYLRDKKITIPYKLDINMTNPRNIVQFMVTIKAITAFNAMTRTKKGNYILSSKADILLAKYLWEKFYKHGLPEHIMKTYNQLPYANGVDKYTLANKLGISPRTVIRHINYLSERGMVKFIYKNKHSYYLKRNFAKIGIKIGDKELDVDDNESQYEELIKYIEEVEE